MNSGPRTVIGVDDVFENRLLLQMMLEQRGYTFYGADSGSACIQMTQRIVPRLILLDVQMPDMDGFETCRRLRQDPVLRHVPIAFLTARKTVEDLKAGMAAGGNDFLVKPFNEPKLIERVEHWIGRRAPPPVRPGIATDREVALAKVSLDWIEVNSSYVGEPTNN